MAVPPFAALGSDAFAAHVFVAGVHQEGIRLELDVISPREIEHPIEPRRGRLDDSSVHPLFTGRFSRRAATLRVAMGPTWLWMDAGADASFSPAMNDPRHSAAELRCVIDAEPAPWATSLLAALGD
jgi:hypothetical protein